MTVGNEKFTFMFKIIKAKAHITFIITGTSSLEIIYTLIHISYIESRRCVLTPTNLDLTILSRYVYLFINSFYVDRSYSINDRVFHEFRVLSITLKVKG